jgi:hypothetical protein
MDTLTHARTVIEKGPGTDLSSLGEYFGALDNVVAYLEPMCLVEGRDEEKVAELVSTVRCRRG